MNDKRIDVLDGVRAIAMGFVVWFHFWQQTWLTPYVSMPQALSKISGISNINLDEYVRFGFVFVDMLILLSAVCNFYPYARSIILGESWPDMKTFYKKRAIRILPSYSFAIAVMFLIANIEHCYPNPGFAVKDLLAHAFCLKTFSPELMMWSPINGVLWTVQIEVLFYILMPWIAKGFRKHPLLMLGSLWICSIITIRMTMIIRPDQVWFVNNMMFSYAALYANGLLLCMIYLGIKKTQCENVYTKILAIIVFLGSLLHLNQLFHALGAASVDGHLQSQQLSCRMEMSFVFMFMMLSIMFLPKWMQLLWANPLMRFISTISYNLYIWHQFIAVKMKQYHIPFWEGSNPPNMTGDKVWMWKYQLIILAMSIFVATIMTYGLEQPISKRLKK